MISPALIEACDHPNRVAERLRGESARVMRVLGQDAPYALLRAAGFLPVRLVPNALPTPQADALIGEANLGQRGRSLLEQILGDTSGDPLLITHADTEQPQIFAALRELMRTGDLAARRVHMLDLLHMPRESSRRYNRVRIGQLADWLKENGGTLSDDALAAAAAEQAEQARIIADCPDGLLRLAGIGAACALPPGQWHAAWDDSTPAQSGTRCLVAGLPQFTTALYAELQAQGVTVVADDQDWGDPLLAGWADGAATLDALAEPARLVPRLLARAEPRADTLLATPAERLVIVAGDHAVAWDVGTWERRAREKGLTIEVRGTDQPAPAENGSDGRRPPQGRRSRKALSSVATFGAFQRGWFGELREQVAGGEPLAVVNANSPQEILRAMGVPFVVNQWWASIVAAKQQSPRYFQLLRDHGYPGDAEAYSAQGVAAAFDQDDENKPWGGLPKPSFVQAVLTTDPTPRIFDHWASETDADLFLFERTVDPRLEIPSDWWTSLPDRWDEVLEPARLDLLMDEMRQAMAAVEARSGKTLDEARLVEVLDLVNEQEEYYRKTRDLIATSYPVPVSIADTMPATMVPQWHRGTVWARDAARDFYEEVVALKQAGEAAAPSEQLRLMWVGRGMWSDMGFYQRWEESHGAVFVWSMYLSLAADGYIRHHDRGRDPLRALAARFVTMGDELRMPTWAGEWHVREAETHGCDGAIALSDADPFVVRALARAGVPVLALDLDNYNRESTDEAAIDRQIADFLEGPVSERRKRRG